MRIAIDIRCLAEGKRSGVEEFTINLLESLFEKDSRNEYVLFYNAFMDASSNEFSSSIDKFSRYSNVKIRRFRYPNKLLNLSFWYLGWPKIDKLVGGADLVYFPNIIFSAVSNSAKKVLTFHDLSFERYPNFFSAKQRFWHFLINPRKNINQYERIIAVSRSTRSDLLNLYGIDGKKVEIIHNSCLKKFRPIDRNDQRLVQTKEKHRLPYRFIYFMGTNEPRKNLLSVIKAFICLHKYAHESRNRKLEEYYLVISGAKGWLNDEITKLMRYMKFREKIIFTNFVEDDDRPYIYNLASLFVYPSFFEGFGFPPLEALKCNTPSIVSNNSSLPEVCGRYALMVDPHKPDELFRIFREILIGDDLKKYYLLSKERIEEDQDWNVIAEKYLKIFNSLKITQ